MHLAVPSAGLATLLVLAFAVVAARRSRRSRSRRERRVRHAQRLRSMGTLAAGIAHEVNNPLAFIRANLSQIHQMGELVAERAGAPGAPDAKLARELADLREIAEETLDGIARIERIVADIRNLGGVGADESYGPTAVGDVVADALRLANLRREPGIRVELRLARALPEVEASGPRLVQALLNLLVNAKQALADTADPCIEIEAAAVGRAVEIRVADNGPGISEELQERIFDPFFTTRDPDQGTGLGLSIAFDILRDHGGELEVRSRPGRGACFIARLQAI